jgi:enoyl-CoA hydratase/carnithine racemase
MASTAFSVSFDEQQHTATVTLCQPDKGNRLKLDDIRALGDAIHAAGTKASVNVVVLRAQGEAFCMGRDVSGGEPPARHAIEMRKNLAEPILDLYRALRATPVPVVAVVQGEARGFGCAVVGLCDLAIASQNARFSLPEMDGNLPPTLAISAVLGKVLPKHLLQLVLTRRQIAAEEAKSLGLLSEVAAADKLDVAAGTTISQIAGRNREALAAVKEYLANAAGMDAASAAQYASAVISVVLASKEK